MTKQMTIKEMNDKTDIAYSYDRYSPSGWNGAIQVLRAHSLNDQEVEAFLLSKHMRWAGDCDETREYGQLNGQTVESYLTKYPQYLEPTYLAKLIEGIA